MIALPIALLCAAVAAERPNVVVILADDLGYGDVRALAPDSRIPTPYLDRLAQQGMSFLDAHSPSAVCTPTRYGLLTGTYAWRSALERGVLGGYSPPLLEPGQATLGTLLQDAGYRTHAIGKWHLGMALPFTDEPPEELPWSGDPGIDWGGAISDGPTHHGFDSFFGVSASLDMAPYLYVRDEHFVGEPADEQPGLGFPHFVRQGPRAAGFRVERVLDDLTREARKFIAGCAGGEAPFFLYLALTAPHKPTWPAPRFRGVSDLGEYGDFVTQVDWSVGEVLDALDQAGIAENTLVVFTSDNGSYMFAVEGEERDHLDDASLQRFRVTNHRSNGPWRGTKADVYEAGHHVPFFVRWPGRVRAASSHAQPICHVDLFATLAQIAGRAVPAGAARDSVSLLPLLSEEEGATRGSPVVHHSGNGTFALREGAYKLVFSSGSGGREKPVGAPFDGTLRLFDLARDPGETRDVAQQQPEVVQRMVAALERLREG